MNGDISVGLVDVFLKLAKLDEFLISSKIKIDGSELVALCHASSFPQQAY